MKKKLDTTTDMEVVAKICARWKYAQALNVANALRSTLIRDTRTDLKLSFSWCWYLCLVLIKYD